MKQYKHIKTGLIATYQNGIYIVPNQLYNIPSSIVENSNDWQEITKPEYTILSFTNIKNTTKDNKNTEYYPSEHVSLERFMKNSDFKIYKIRRESDGEVFTVDGVVEYCKNSYRIKSFEINIQFNKIIVNVEWILKNESKQFELNSLNKKKQPLFTTEDGVDIYEGDTYAIVYRDWYMHESYGELKDSSWLKDSKTKSFSTKKAAEEYILMNKPCLSLKDVLNTLKVHVVTTNKLKTLIKERL